MAKARTKREIQEITYQYLVEDMAKEVETLKQCMLRQIDKDVQQMFDHIKLGGGDALTIYNLTSKLTKNTIGIGYNSMLDDLGERYMRGLVRLGQHPLRRTGAYQYKRWMQRRKKQQIEILEYDTRGLKWLLEITQGSAPSFIKQIQDWFGPQAEEVLNNTPDATSKRIVVWKENMTGEDPNNTRIFRADLLLFDKIGQPIEVKPRQLIIRVSIGRRILSVSEEFSNIEYQ